MQKLTLVAAMMLGGLLACSMPASAQDAKDGKKGRGPSVEQRVKMIDQAVTLTADQKPKVTAVLEKSAKKRQEMFQDQNIPREQRREKMQTLMQEENKKLKEILTSEQYQKYIKARDELRKRGGKEGKKDGQQDSKKD